MTAMRTCKKCGNRYAASAFATRTGFICKWCKKGNMDEIPSTAQERAIDCPRCGHCCPQPVSLTDEQISVLWYESGQQPFKFARMISDWRT